MVVVSMVVDGLDSPADATPSWSLLPEQAAANRTVTNSSAFIRRTIEVRPEVDPARVSG
jgi:hypothetical protein